MGGRGFRKIRRPGGCFGLLKYKAVLNSLWYVCGMQRGACSSAIGSSPEIRSARKLPWSIARLGSNHWPLPCEAWAEYVRKLCYWRGRPGHTRFFRCRLLQYRSQAGLKVAGGGAEAPVKELPSIDLSSCQLLKIRPFLESHCSQCDSHVISLGFSPVAAGNGSCRS